MKYVIISSAAIMFFAGMSIAQSKGDGCEGLSKKVAALISQYKELRDKRRRSPQGSFDRDLDGYGGKLHEVLYSLGVELGHPPFTKRKIVACLGEPDAIKSGDQMGHYLDIYNRELMKAGRKIEEKSGREYLIYYWRGGHDFMFFINEDGMIVDHGWWFAYE